MCISDREKQYDSDGGLIELQFIRNLDTTGSRNKKRRPVFCVHAHILTDRRKKVYPQTYELPLLYHKSVEK